MRRSGAQRHECPPWENMPKTTRGGRLSARLVVSL
jgi:hypothetical protein